MWTLTDALTLIRDLQPELRTAGYHLALGGGVLNRGGSQKDLDLYLLPTYNEGPRNLALALRVFEEWGRPMIGRLKHPDLPVVEPDGSDSGAELGPRYYVLYASLCDGQRIDLFVVKD